MQPPISYNPDEIPHLRSQNDQLWKIIEKQRVMIQNLQKDNVRLSTERDGLQDKISQLEQEFTRKKRVTSLIISPTMQEMDDKTPLEVATMSPMPPPRSPYRPLNKPDTSLSEESEEWAAMNGRSSPGSPAPSPIYSNIKFNATSPNLTSYHHHKQRKGSDPISPSKSISSSSSLKMEEEALPRAEEEEEDDKMINPLENTDLQTNTNDTTTIHTTTNSTSSTINNSNNDNNNNNNDLDQLAKNHAERNTLLKNPSSITIRVVGSNITANEKGKEVVSFTLGIGTKNDENNFDERWRVEKLYSDFLALDSQLKTQHPNRAVSAKIGKLPDKALFSSNAPNKVDQRKVAIEQYLQHVVTLALEDNTDLFEFLSTDIVNAKAFQKPGIKEGYLTKRGKNFGGWKTRYFVLNENVLEYYESKEGTQLGGIRLTNAQIGRQMPGSSPEENVYRHAFLIVEQKRSGSSHYVRHILCASSDDDRDEWVQALLMRIQVDEEDPAQKKKNKSKTSSVRKLSKGEIRPIAAVPISHLKMENDMEKLTVYDRPSPSISSGSSDSLHWHEMRSSFDQPSHRQAKPVMRRSSMGNLINSNEEEPPSEPEKKVNSKKAANRMTFWGRKMFSSDQQPPRPSQSSSTTSSGSNGGLRGFLSRTSHEQGSGGERIQPQVFGVPLEEAVRISRVKEDYELPAVVYRCIEYLDAMNAVLEEGLYRLSGSNATMKALRERFNQEGDVNLLESKDEYDIHVVAGLLKMWLRELPTSVLTREHRMEFLHVIDLFDRKDRVNELGRLVSVLPLPNYTLLRALTAHLIRVVQHSDINKMTMRNVSIVFSPTLGIPATIFHLFLSEFEYIFWTTEDGNAAPRRLEEEEEPKRNSRLKEEQDGRNNRNSVSYVDGAPHAIVDLEKNLEGTLVLEEEDGEEDDLSLDTDDSI
ncbi:RhoGAP-domain-containing protein [Backusella circina FSU 941]|nr:RhoGAP-domain-containing protein [Backusella circina FSU 941]